MSSEIYGARVLRSVLSRYSDWIPNFFSIAALTRIALTSSSFFATNRPPLKQTSKSASKTSSMVFQNSRDSRIKLNVGPKLCAHSSPLSRKVSWGICPWRLPEFAPDAALFKPDRSIKVTSRPSCAKKYARAQPEIPPPITSTSVSIWLWPL